MTQATITDSDRSRHFLPTGEYRLPRKGEWYLGRFPDYEAFEAIADHDQRSPLRIILREVDPPGVFPPWWDSGAKESGSPYNTDDQSGRCGLYAFRTFDNFIAIEPAHGPSSVLIREEAIRFARDILRHYGESP